jgi:hypothetical protein
VDNTKIEATAYHPFWVIEGRDLQERSKPRELQEHEDEGHSLPGRWVNSHELRAGDCIITRSGTRALITEIRQRFDDAFPVSNLSIIGHHNYAVGDVGVLVHNESVCDETIAELRKYYAAGFSDDEIRDWLRSQTKDGKRRYDDADIDVAMGKIKPKAGSTRHIDLEYADNGGYKIEFESETGYAGKGGTERARQSARRHSRENNDPVKSIEHFPADNDQDAFDIEATFLNELGGPKSPRNYNKNNSPGTPF